MTNSDTNNFNGQRVITTEIQQTDYFSLNPVKKNNQGCVTEPNHNQNKAQRVS